MQQISLLLAAALVVCVQGQYLYSIAGGDIGDSSLTSICNKTFSVANATGTFEIDPGVPELPNPDNNSGEAKPIQLGVTVTEKSERTGGHIEWTLWMSTNGANYSDDLALGYDVCMFTIQPISTNTLLRGQTDTGNCVKTFDSECTSALEDAASAYALGLINNATPAPNSNLTADSLGRVCYDIANSLENSFPQQCQKYMNSTTITVGGSALTSYMSSGVYNTCGLKDTSDGVNYHMLYTAYDQYNSAYRGKAVYAGFNWEILPVMLTFMPVANINAGNGIQEASSSMACVRADKVNPGSETPPVAPKPTAIGSGGLSGGAIAGIVVGVVAGIALIAGAAFLFWWRKRKSRKAKATDTAPTDHPPAYTDAQGAHEKEQPSEPPIAEAPADNTLVKELTAESEVRPELPTHKSGTGWDHYGPVEKGNGAPPAELLAEVPNTPSSTNPY